MAGINVGASTISLGNTDVCTAAPGGHNLLFHGSRGYWIGTVEAQATAVGGAGALSVWPTPYTPHAS